MNVREPVLPLLPKTSLQILRIQTPRQLMIPPLPPPRAHPLPLLEGLVQILENRLFELDLERFIQIAHLP